MNLLLIIPYTPTPIRVRPYNLVRALSKRGHRITLATLWSSEAEKAQLAEFEREGIQVLASRLSPLRSLWNCARTLPRPTPLQSMYCWEPALFEHLKSQILKPNSQFDLVHVEHLRGARYGTHLQSAIRGQQLAVGNELAASGYQPSAIPLVWDSVDWIS